MKKNLIAYWKAVLEKCDYKKLWCH